MLCIAIASHSCCAALTQPILQHFSPVLLLLISSIALDLVHDNQVAKLRRSQHKWASLYKLSNCGEQGQARLHNSGNSAQSIQICRLVQHDSVLVHALQLNLDLANSTSHGQFQKAIIVLSCCKIRLSLF